MSLRDAQLIKNKNRKPSCVQHDLKATIQQEENCTPVTPTCSYAYLCFQGKVSVVMLDILMGLPILHGL